MNKFVKQNKFLAYNKTTNVVNFDLSTDLADFKVNHSSKDVWFIGCDAGDSAARKFVVSDNCAHLITNS